MKTIINTFSRLSALLPGLLFLLAIILLVLALGSSDPQLKSFMAALGIVAAVSCMKLTSANKTTNRQ